MNRLDGQLGSGRASIQNGAWVEAGWKGDYTLVTFDAPIYAFGADWKMKVDSGLLLFTNGGPVAAFPINLSGDQIYRGLTYNGFFGFVSELPFTQVVIESGSACNAERASRASCYDVADDAQAFTMENLVITVAPQAATAPEPGTVGLVGLTLAAIAVLLRSRFPSNCARKTT
ncbi:MAG: hypothetical protein JOY54_01830 [Acidobacteriaceae bacterium]|nr:hypothetical protein [Acidobacteriaceae bacterium]